MRIEGEKGGNAAAKHAILYSDCLGFRIFYFPFACI